MEELICGPAIIRPPPPHPVDWAQKVSMTVLDEWQADFMMWDGQDALLNCTRQGGKALALDTPLPTPSGWTTMGEVMPGDMLFDETGTPCRVTAVSPIQHGRECFIVRFGDGSEILADAEHRWYVEPANNLCNIGRARPNTGINGGRAPGIRTTREILADLHVKGSRAGSVANVWAVPVAEALELPDIDLPIPPYVLGAWLGDGNSNSANITIGEEDWQETTKNLRAKGVTVIERINANRTNCVLLDPRGSVGATMHAKLSSLGVLKNKHIPSFYLRASIRQRLSLMQGLMDTDGYAAKNGKVEFCTTDAMIAGGFFDLAVSLGFKPRSTMGVARLRGKDIGPKWRVTFTAYSDMPVFRLTRKLARLRNSTGIGNRPSETRRRFICDIIPVESVPVKCVAVDSLSHLYLAGRSMIPTHNTQIVSLRAAYRAGFYDRVVGCLGPTSRQTSRMFRRSRRWLLNGGLTLSRNVGLELELPHGGQIQAFPGDRPDVSIRGDTLDDVIIDEASVIKDDLIAAATPTTATREDRCIVYLSTPKGQRGAFYKEWVDGGPQDDPWHRVTITADQCPRISKKFLEKERKRLGPLFRQEYYCEFLATPGALFSAEDISNLFRNEPIAGFRMPAATEVAEIW